MLMLYRMLRDCNHWIYGKLLKNHEYELTEKEVSGLLRFVEPVEVRDSPFTVGTGVESSSSPAAQVSREKMQKKREKLAR